MAELTCSSQEDYASWIEYIPCEKDKECNSTFHDVTERRVLDREKVFSKCYSSVFKALGSANVWQKYPRLYREAKDDLTTSSRSSSHLEMIWHGEM